MKFRQPVYWLGVVAIFLMTSANASDFGSKGGAEPANIESFSEKLRERPYFMEVYRRLLRTGYRKFNLGSIPNVR